MFENKNITIIAALGKNRKLGKKNKLIWKIKEDLEFFKKETMGKSMIMRFNTFYSLRNGKPIKGRMHLVLTRNRENEI